MAQQKLGVRAFVVSVDDYGAEVIYAESAGQARARGMTDFHTFTEREVKRAPELDQYLAKGGPSKADLIQHGWWFECYICGDHVDGESGGIHGNKPYCADHLPEPRPPHGEEEAS